MPGFEASLGTHLDRHTVGYLRYNSNWRLDRILLPCFLSSNFRVFDTEDSILMEESDSGMCTMLTRNTEHHQTTVSLQFGIPSTYLIIANTWKFNKPKRTARLALKVFRGKYFNFYTNVTDFFSLGLLVQ